VSGRRGVNGGNGKRLADNGRPGTRYLVWIEEVIREQIKPVFYEENT